MKKLRPILALLLALMMLPALSACGSSAARDDDEDEDGRPSRRRTEREGRQSAVVDPFSLGGEEAARSSVILSSTQTTSTTHKDDQSYLDYSGTIRSEYDERGLLTRYTIESDGSEETTIYHYDFDEHGNPSRVRMTVDEDEYCIEIENHYNGDTLTEAVICDIIMDGESGWSEIQGKAPGDRSVMIDATLQIPFNALRNYTGYRNCTLLLSDEDDRLVYENGKLVYEYRVTGDMATEIITSESASGTVSTNRFYLYGPEGWTLTSGTEATADRRMIPCSMRFFSPDFVAVLQLRQEKDGNEVKVYIDDIELDPQTDAPETEQFRQLRGKLFFLCTLDKAGRVTEIRTMPVLPNFSSGVTYYDAQGRTLGYETVTDTDSMRYENRMEFEYR